MADLEPGEVESPPWSDRVLEVGVTVLLVVMPWHEFIVHLWKPLGAWDECVVAGLAVALLTRRIPWRLALPMGALLLAGVLSAAVNGTSLWPLRGWGEYFIGGLAASQIPPDRVRPLLRRLVAVATAAAAYGLVTFVAFRLSGGGHLLRPDIDSAWLRGLVYPYYCGTYPRGGHLVGPFLNDLYFGVWLVAVLCVTWGLWTTSRHRRRYAVAAAIMLAAAAWTYSRTALVSVGVATIYLAVRATPLFLVVGGGVAMLALPWLNPMDRLRFSGGLLEGDAGRVAMWRRTLDTLISGAWTGLGPGAIRLADAQYARLVVELGWPGLVTLVWLLGVSVAPAFRRGAGILTIALGGAVLALLTGGISSEILEVPQTAHTLWILVGLLSTAGIEHGERKSA